MPLGIISSKKGSERSERSEERERKKLFHLFAFRLFWFSWRRFGERAGADCWKAVRSETCVFVFILSLESVSIHSFSSIWHVHQFPSKSPTNSPPPLPPPPSSSHQEWFYSKIVHWNVFIVFNSIKIGIIWINEKNKWLWMNAEMTPANVIGDVLARKIIKMNKMSNKNFCFSSEISLAIIFLSL